jgi:predicted DNA-binding transcriptional regulator YafY
MGKKIKNESEVTKQPIRIRQKRRATRETTVRIIFDAEVAPLVRERQWFKSQQITTLADGRIELSARTSSLVGIDLWIFGWGPCARVLEPSRLRRRIREIAQKIVARG